MGPLSFGREGNWRGGREGMMFGISGIRDQSPFPQYSETELMLCMLQVLARVSAHSVGI